MGAFAEPDGAVQPATGAKLALRKPRRDAVQFLIAEIERAPGEVTLLAIGPMTNIALALRLRPDIETKIKRIVFMGGNVKVAGNATSLAEFNFWFDPEAARIVLRSRIPQKIMFGLDICDTAPIRKAEFDQIANAHTPIADLYREDLGNRYPAFLKNPGATAYLWDSLAAAYLLDPGFVTKSESQYLDVITAWGKFYGATTKLDRSLAPRPPPCWWRKRSISTACSRCTGKNSRAEIDRRRRVTIDFSYVQNPRPDYRSACRLHERRLLARAAVVEAIAR